MNYKNDSYVFDNIEAVGKSVITYSIYSIDSTKALKMFLSEDNAKKYINYKKKDGANLYIEPGLLYVDTSMIVKD